MSKQELIERIKALLKEAGITHDQLANIVFEARDNRLREIRDQYQDSCILFYFNDGLILHQLKNRTVAEMADMFPETLREMIMDYERKEGELGMMLNNNIPKSYATFPMAD